MTENKNNNAAPVKSTESKPSEPTEAQLAASLKNLPGELQTAITDLKKSIDDHNEKVDAIKAAEAQNPTQIKAEIFEQNPRNNKKLASLLAEYQKLVASAEKIRMDAYKVIDTDGLMPRDLSETEIQKLKTETAESLKLVKAGSTTLEGFESMIPAYKGKLLIHLPEIKTRRGAAKTSATGDCPKRPRFKKIEVNGVTQDDKGNTVWQKTTDNEQKYTMGFLRNYLAKQHKGIKWTTKELQDAYFGDKEDQSELPEVHTFVMPYTFKDQSGNEQTVNYTIKAYR